MKIYLAFKFVSNFRNYMGPFVISERCIMHDYESEKFGI